MQATISYADSMNLSLVLRFTDPTAPLYIGIDGENDSAETLFVISTSQVHGAPSRQSNVVNDMAGNAKREREERTVTPAPSKKLIRAVQPAETPLRASSNRKETPSRALLPSFPVSQAHHDTQPNLYFDPPDAPEHQPLFLPSPPRATVDKRRTQLNHVSAQESSPDSRRSISEESADASLQLQLDRDEDEMELDATQSTYERLNVASTSALAIHHLTFAILVSTFVRGLSQRCRPQKKLHTRSKKIESYRNRLSSESRNSQLGGHLSGF